MLTDSIRSLYDQYVDDIYRYAKLTLGDADEAKDVTQEVFVRAFSAWESFRHDATPKTWLMKIARNYMYDLLRKKRTQRKAINQYRAMQTYEHSDDSERKLILEEAVSQLKDSYRQVFVLRHVQNCSVQEAANILGWSENKVTTTDQRAIQKLRTFLGSDNEEVDVHYE